MTTDPAVVAHAKKRAQELADAIYPDDPAKECDIVMKGGITSGIVYPLAVCELAKTYKFRQVGGTSAGAIAATMTAAAEHGRATGSFKKLANMPEVLGHTMTGLFRPQPATKGAYDVLLAAVDPDKGKLALLAKVIRGRAGWFVTGLVPFYLFAVPAFLVTGGLPDHAAAWGQLVVAALVVLPIASLLGLVFALAGHALRAFKGLGSNGYGLVIGSEGAAGNDAKVPTHLTDWMAKKLDDLAGLGPQEGPLTFGDLRKKDITLEVMTTNVTFGRPARFPFSAASSNAHIYMFCEKEWEKYFPHKVFSHLKKTTTKLKPECPEHHVPLRHLPELDDMPVIVATRISLSFPGLISAVPLWSVDHAVKPGVLVRCWFSDGGITSNFPIHFFDSLFPRRPTFGITLRPYHAAHPESDVYRPDKDATTRVPVVKNTTTVGGFFHGILDTMQNWSDDAQCMLPGFWDRVVELHLHDDEGGMNLAMPADTIAVVAERGRQAAECLDDFDFPQHRWARYLTSMSELQAHAVRLGTVLTKRLPDGSDGYTEFVKTYGHEKHRFHREPEWCDAAAAMTSGLVTAMDDKLHDFTQSPPRPDPDLRVTPHF